MGFLSPWFLGGLLAVGLPLYLHLLKQHRSDPMRFSSAMFLERRTETSVRRRRLKYLALLAMRLAVIILLALLFANPFIRRQETAGSGKKFVVVAVDNSFSMRAGGRLERAKQEALEVVNQLRPGDRAQVLSFASTAELRTQPIDDAGQLKAAVQSVQAGDGRSAYGELTRTLRNLKPGNGLPVEAHVFTDAQRSSMPVPFSELAVTTDMRLVVHAVADRAEPNWFVESVTVPASVYQPQSVRVRATVAGANTDAREATMTLAINGRDVESKKVSLEAGGRATAEFTLKEVTYGWNRGEVRMDGADSLPQDDRFLFAVERREASRVLLVHDPKDSRSPLYVRAAIDSVPDAGFAVDAIAGGEAGAVPLEKYAAVILADAGSLSSTFENNLAKYAERGGGVLVAVGPSTSARGFVPLTKQRLESTRYADRGSERFWTAAEFDTAHPSVAKASGLAASKFYRVAELEPKDGRVLAKLSNGWPLLVEHKRGEGKVIVLASTLDNVSNDLPLHPSFVPFLEQTVQHLSGTRSASSQYPVDSFAELRSGRDTGSAVDVLDPAGNRALSLKEAAASEAFRLPSEGFWEIRRGNGRNAVIAVHADRRESNLDVVPAETLALWQGGTADREAAASAAAADGEKPYSIWWWFALALLVASLIESIFAGRYLLRREPEMMVQKKAA